MASPACSIAAHSAASFSSRPASHSFASAQDRTGRTDTAFPSVLLSIDSPLRFKLFWWLQTCRGQVHLDRRVFRPCCGRLRNRQGTIRFQLWLHFFHSEDKWM